ncbi:N,N-dimethylformamidase beta subunit family domain-containing protein [Metarhizobium album]|uniref:N,N-dimethylformamidase beta subunit family domain-containing protein n=1 Tax=Metarhizobium album TaxID=2182425 RepID=UPI001403A32B|nr:N,N-dimethylformamidase beta subunit family domain-containing protein [Rhizobium album]
MSSHSTAAHYQAVFGRYFETPANLPPGTPFLWAYADRHSYGAGETVCVHVNTTANRFRATLVRDGFVPVTVWQKGNIEGAAYETPDQCSAEGCGWLVCFSFTIEAGWPSGGYKLMLWSEENSRLTAETILIVRPTPGQGRGRLLFVPPTCTWMAYNDWGGSNFYEGISGPERNQFSPVVSADRPFCRGFASLPPDAPRVALDHVPGLLAPPRYPHMEWAWRTGHSKKYASSGWASYDRHFFHWMERQGYAVDIIAQTDLHYRPDIIDSYSCLVFAGHDEYWSWQMRDAVDAYVEAGGHVARYAGNFMWQIRLEDEGRRQICYKYRARNEDPVYGTGNARFATTSWEAAEIGRPGALTFGLNATRGMYTGWGGAVARGARGFPIYRPEHWAFAGTGYGYGDVLGAASHAFGYEVDGLDYVIKGGLPYPSGEEQVPEGLSILALGLACNVEEGDAVKAGDVFLNSEDAVFIAEILYGETGPEAVDRAKRGSGMIVNFPKGKGEVFHAGSCEWVAGLIRGDAGVEAVTRNVFNRYLA